MTALDIFILITSGINLLVGIVVFVRNPRASLHQSFLLFCFGSSLWTVSYFLLGYTQSLIFDRLILLGAIIATAGIFLFSKYFPLLKNHTLNKRDLLAILPLVVCSLFLFDNLIVQEVIFMNSNPVPIKGSLFEVFAITIISYLGLSIYHLIKNFRKSNPLEQNRLLIFIFSIVFFVLISVIFNLLLPTFGLTHLNHIGHLCLSLFVLATAYTLIARRLLDVSIILKNTFTYLSLLVCISFVYYALVVFAQELFTRWTGFTYHIQYISVAIVAISIPYIDRILRRMSDRWLGINTYNYAHSLLAIVEEISKAQTLEDTIERVTAQISLQMKVRDTRIVIAPPYASLSTYDPLFNNNNCTIYIPMVLKDHYIATVSVSNKISGEKFTHRDVSFLQTICVYLASHLRTLKLLRQTQQYSHVLEGEIQDSEENARQIEENQNKMIVDIAHNLQTPLTILKGELYSLSKAQKRFTKRDIKRLDETVDRLSGFVTRLLQAGNITNNSTPMMFFNLSELLLDICEYTQTVADQQGIEVRYEVQEGISMYGRSMEIRDVIINILNNAMKYRKHEGNHIITVQAVMEDDITIMISDTGVGIEPQELPHIFKQWYQANPLKLGSGLGLSIAHKVIQWHGGTIEVESTPDVGTRFCIIFPQQKTR